MHLSIRATVLLVEKGTVVPHHLNPERKLIVPMTCLARALPALGHEVFARDGNGGTYVPLPSGVGVTRHAQVVAFMPAPDAEGSVTVIIAYEDGRLEEVSMAQVRVAFCAL